MHWCIPGIMNTMLTHDAHPDAASQASERKAMIGAEVGMLILVVLLGAAIAAADSVLGWVLAGLILGWLGLACYLVLGVLSAVRANRASYKALAHARAEEQDGMLADKLSHSFQIVLVQSREISKYLDEDGEQSRAMIERALDTINTTASNGMGMVNDEMRGEE